MILRRCISPLVRIVNEPLFFSFPSFVLFCDFEDKTVSVLFVIFPLPLQHFGLMIIELLLLSLSSVKFEPALTAHISLKLINNTTIQCVVFLG